MPLRALLAAGTVLSAKIAVVAQLRESGLYGFVEIIEGVLGRWEEAQARFDESLGQFF